MEPSSMCATVDVVGRPHHAMLRAMSSWSETARHRWRCRVRVN
jgi:hypothetical protein